MLAVLMLLVSVPGAVDGLIKGANTFDFYVIDVLEGGLPRCLLRPWAKW